MSPTKSSNRLSSASSSSSPTKQKKQVTAVFPHSQRYSLRSASTIKRERKPAQVINVQAPIIKKKLVRAGKGKTLKDITHIRTAIKEAEVAGLHYHLSVLHNLMYGFSGTGKTRVKDILNFSGYPADVNRETKLRSMYASGPLRYGNNYYVRLFLSFFGLETSGKKDELYERFLDFMFHPK